MFAASRSRRLATRWASAMAALVFAWLFLATEAQAGPCRSGETAVDYTVKSGDSFSKIAHAHGVGSAIVERSNPGVDPRSIRPGQEIKVCVEKESSSSGSSKSKKKRSRVSCGGGNYLVEHEVVRGDTLSKLARDYGSSTSSILRRNSSLDGDASRIRVGQTLKICGDTGGAHEGIGGRSSGKKSRTCGMRTPIWVHEVVPGEIVSSVAARYGVRRKDLYRLNSSLANNPNLIRPGQDIRVCPEIAPRERKRVEHKVRSGESLSTIAKKYGLTTRELLAFQRGKVKASDGLRAGQTLTVYEDGRVVPGFGAIDSDEGTLSGGVLLRSGSYYTTKASSLSWGTSKTIRLIQKAIAAYRQRSKGGPKVHVGDISRKAGGPFPPHRSHQHGRDVDIGYVLTGEHRETQRFVRASSSNFDAMRSYRLIKAFIDTNEVQYVFVDYYVQKMLYDYAKSRGVSQDTLEELFQYPRGKGRSAGIIRHWKGHDDHFHVRFRR